MPRMGIVKDLPEQYAKYIAQRLEEQIRVRTENAIVNLEDSLNTEDILDQRPPLENSSSIAVNLALSPEWTNKVRNGRDQVTVASVNWSKHKK